MSGKEIGKRFKENYEHRQRFFLLKRTPVIIRVDGRAFHTFTRAFDKPFDASLIAAFVRSTIRTSKEMSGFKLAYCQSDEISFLLTDYDSFATEPWFGYNKSKLESITSSIFTANFNNELGGIRNVCKMAYFDARAFNVPENEVANYFLWRALDWQRNSVSMYCMSFFSHKQMLNKGMHEQHEMLYSIGKNWTKDLRGCEKNGTFIGRSSDIITNTEPNYAAIEDLVKKQFKSEE